MWMSKEEMEAEYDYKEKANIVQEEEESWAKLCSKLVSKILPIIKNRKWKKSIEIHAYYTPNTPYCRGTQNIL